MIKRSKRKLKIKKNPYFDDFQNIPLNDDEIDEIKANIRYALVEGKSNYLADAILISKSGMSCSDCDERYDKCNCDYCSDCKLRKCMCDWNFNISTSYNNDVRKLAWIFAEKIFNKKELYYLKNNIITDLKNRIKYLSRNDSLGSSGSNLLSEYELTKDYLMKIMKI